MKLIEYSRLNKLAKEYCILGQKLGYFNAEQAKVFLGELQNLDVIIDNTIDGDAYINTRKNILKINANRTFASEESASLFLFHEFTHKFSSVHEDFHHCPNGCFATLKNKVSQIVPRKMSLYDYKNETYDIGDDFNPLTYIQYGGLLIDEVTSEYVATRMVSKKFGKPLPQFNPTIGGKYIEPANISYYSSGQRLVNGFARTLFLKSSDKNINGLCKKIFDRNFPKELIRQHCEKGKRVSPLVYLCRELGLMGVMALYEEEKNGRVLRNNIPSDFAYHCYEACKVELDSGFEHREYIPSSFTLPEYLELQ